MEPADGPVELRFGDLGGMVGLDESFLCPPGGCQQVRIHLSSVSRR